MTFHHPNAASPIFWQAAVNEMRSPVIGM